MQLLAQAQGQEQEQEEEVQLEEEEGEEALGAEGFKSANSTAAGLDCEGEEESEDSLATSPSPIRLAGSSVGNAWWAGAAGQR